MLVRQFEWLPLRPRGLIVIYARPNFVEWKFPDKIRTTVEREDQFGLVTAVETPCGQQCFAAVASLPFAFSTVLEWTATIRQDPEVYVGITRRAHPWMRTAWPPLATHEETCIEPTFDSDSGTIRLREITFNGLFLGYLDGGDVSAYMERVFKTGRRVHFAVDLSSNLLTVSFERYQTSVVVADLASYRPFCYFFYSIDRQSKVSF